MNPEADSLSSRVVAICCKSWGISPAECRELQEAGEISVLDFMTTLELEVVTSPISWLTQRPVLLEWLFPEGERARQKKLNDKFEALLLMDMPVDPASADILEGMRQQVIQAKAKPTVKVKTHAKQ